MARSEFGFVVVLTILIAPALFGDVLDDSSRGFSVRSADLIVIGVLHKSFRIPWLDGWHEHGYIVVEETLKGTAKPRQELSFRWERDFVQGWCYTRPDWRFAVDQTGIWLLHEAPRGGWWAPSMFDNFLPVESKYEVARLVREAGRVTAESNGARQK